MKPNKLTRVLTQLEKDISNFAKRGSSTRTANYLSGRLSLLEKSMETAQNAYEVCIGSMEDDDEDKYSEIEEIYEKFRELYFDYRADLLDATDKVKVKETKADNNEEGTNVTMSIHNSDVRLKNIPVPVFSGNYETWRSFRDLFVSLVHHNSSLSEIQKMHYLKTSISGEAEKILSHLPISNGNYVKAWTILQDRYDHQRFLVNTQLKCFFSQPSVTQERSEAIKELLDTSTEIVHSLANLKVPVEHWDVILIYVLLQKLPTKTQQLWEEKLGCKENSKQVATFVEFKQFLESRFRTLEAVSYQGKTTSEPSKRVPQRNSFHAQATTSKFICKLCNNGQHAIRKCNRFLKMSIKDRYQAISKLGLCKNCLAYSHLSESCPSIRRCYYCQQPHHSLLHNSQPIAPQANYTSHLQPCKMLTCSQNSQHQNTNCLTSSINPRAPSFKPHNMEQPSPNQRDDQLPNEEACCSKSVHTYHSVSHTNTQVMLATAIVKVSGSSGEVVSLRALLDSGSEASFITESALQLLRLKHKSTFVEVSGLGMVNSSTCNRIVDVTIGSHHSAFVVNTKALVYKSLSGHIPARTLPVADWRHLDGLSLADPCFFRPAKVDLLLGSDILAEVLLPELVRPNNANLPLAQNTKFGWILFGRAPLASRSAKAFHQTCNLEADLRKFWELEEVPFQTPETPEHIACEEHFLNNVKRVADGRCEVALPFKGNIYPVLGRSKEGALQRFQQLEGRLLKNKRFHEEYAECIEEYLRMGHMIEVNQHMLENTPHYFLPHHAVIKESSSSTKLRVVFDASFKTSDGTSLNDRLMTGPALQNNIIDVILRWRLYGYTFTADIEKMYRQIWVTDKDSFYQLILWRKDPSEPIKIYRLKTVTFGTASAPYLAIRTLNWLAEESGCQFPRAAKMIWEEMYVDDLISGADTTEEAKKKIKEVKTTLGAAGLNLRKWASNNVSLLKDVPVEERETTFSFPAGGSAQLKMLGIYWHPNEDNFLYRYTPPRHHQTTTKRSILSTIAKLFDPMGWISPCVIKAKCFLQLLWAKKLTWDEPIDEELKSGWNIFFHDLESINQIRLPRWVQSGQRFKTVEIHGFSDASEKAFGAVVYIRVLGERGLVHMNLLFSKTRVAPLKPVSIPRLELCGAVILARLLKHVISVLNLPEAKIHAWTDSTITLCWIRSPPLRLETFVGNRVGEIHRLTSSSVWKHIPTEQNPADLASRGVLPSALIQNRLWWKGPTFLNTSWDFEMPTQPTNLKTDEGQKRTRCLMLETEDNQILRLISRASRFQRLVRIIAYCQRFINIFRQHHRKFCNYARSLRKDNTNRPFTPTELDEATRSLIRVAQRQMFPDGITKTRGMGSLNPFVDRHGVIRVGGRLSQANIPYNQQHPMILDPNNQISILIIRDVHLKSLHGGIQLMMEHLRHKFWIFKLKRALKKHIHSCITCYRFRAQKAQQLMGELPAPRVTMSRPFTHTGIDYAGPVNIRTWKGRGAKCHKGYLAIFICLATKAIHIEVVTDLTSQAFIAAFRRFAARRGVCAQIYSDCGTNFVGADVELRRLLKSGTQDYKEIANVLATEGTKWNFIPPASPHFGGLWEAGVKSVKFHLKRIVGNGTLTYEELATFLTQVEACLNSRPLCPLTEDPADYQALTPAHFLVGESLFTVPEADLTIGKQNLVDRWKIIQRNLQTFWKQWQSEYLSRLQHRPKWLKPQPQLMEGDLVLISDERLPSAKWNLGRIIETYPGADNVTRVVKVKTQYGEFRRPITKLCPLPLNDAKQST